MKKTLIIIAFFLVSFTLNAQEITDQNVFLKQLKINAEDNNVATKLIKKVIENRKQNSPERLPNFSFNSYTKIYNEFAPLISLNKMDKDTKSDFLDSKKSLEFLAEKANRYIHDECYGNKIITDAYRISGLQSDLPELIAITPLPYELDEKTFNFFYFKTFINPISAHGINFYSYRIKDTIQLNDRKTIQVNFKSIKEVETPLYGTIWVDADTKGVAKFEAEYVNSDDYIFNSGGFQILDKGTTKSYEMVSNYKFMNNVWLPTTQYYKLLSIKTKEINGVETKVSSSSTIMEKVFSDFKFDNYFMAKDFKGYSYEIDANARKDFEQRIISYRPQDLTPIEKNTYIKIDKEGKEENLDFYLKKARFLINGLNFNLGKVDLILPELYGNNEYEGSRVGIGFRTNEYFDRRLSFNGHVNYGFKDKEFKYGVGTKYLAVPENNGTISFDYMNDLNAAGRFFSPLRTGFNVFRVTAINGNKYDFFQQEKFSLAYQQDFFNNLTLRLGAHHAKEKNLFNPILENQKFNNNLLTFNLKWSPFSQYVKVPYGVHTLVDGSPNIYLNMLKSNKLAEGDFDFTRIEGAVEYQFYLFPRETYIKVNAGTTLGKTPLWYSFNQGSNNPNESVFDIFNLGGSDTFETMPADTFYSTQFVSFLGRQKLFNLNGKKKKAPTYFVVKTMYGKIKSEDLMYADGKIAPNKWFSEAGLEFRQLLLGTVGVGVYYRFGSYNVGEIKQDLSIKSIINLPFAKIKF
ncbi:hypothetical protein EDL98_03635 [Ornithobacterium rhinotracheale]|uniref:DUF5686 family protein n=1 Tax=Ornithobacterium rhinotracheale TaxID=28251 RepID=UPI00129CD3B7|nr:DUF5686 family protein [Ornithobacterium rhinotracheale]MRJ10168.1 hypothetical protein [Ornithobacterium rhinotracheale]